MSSPLAPPPNETPEQRKARLDAAYAVQARIDAQKRAELDAQERARAASLPGPLPAPPPLPVPAAQPTGGLPAVAQPTGGLTAAQPTFDEDDYTGRMGPGGEPERYSTMSGGDPRLVQQREIERQQQRLKEPVTIRSWMTTNKKDVRGTKPADNITLQPGKQYQIIDFTGKNSGEVIASGSTPEEFLRIQDIAENLASKGRMADWRLQEVSDEPSNSKFGSALEPTTGKYITTLGGDLYNKSGWSTVADIAKIAVPIALQFIPGLGTALGTSLLGAKAGATGATLGAKILGAGLTSAIGRAGTGVATGEKLGTALKAGAISGLGSAATAGILGALSAPTPGSGLVPSDIAGTGSLGFTLNVPVAPTLNFTAGGLGLGGISGIGADALDDIVVTGVRKAATSGLSNLGSSAISAATGAGTGALATAAPQPSQPPSVEEPGIVVSGSRITPPGTTLPFTFDPSVIPRFDVPRVEPPPVEPPPVDEEPEIKVEADRTRITPPGTTLPFTFDPSVIPRVDVPRVEPPAPPTTTEEPEQVVTNKKDLDITAPFSVAGSAVGDLTKPSTDTKGDNTGDKKKDTLDKIADAATIAGIVIPAIDALTGGGKGGGGTGTYTSGKDALNSVFTDKLPKPGEDGAFTVGGLGTPTGPNPLAVRPTADWYRYATGPAMDMPRGVDLNKATSPYAGFGPGTLGEKTFERVTTGMAHGGSMGYSRGSSRKSFAVEGPGDGRSDDIPAVLSDGEYVIDAETVALLGDGSSRAGAKKLDELRVKIRKHKGKNLAKGKFSVNAKPLEAYMHGGRI